MLSFILLLLTFSVYFDKKEAEGRRESESLMDVNLEVDSRQLGLKEHHPSVPHAPLQKQVETGYPTPSDSSLKIYSPTW